MFVWHGQRVLSDGKLQVSDLHFFEVFLEHIETA